METTGLSPRSGELTVIGICLEDDHHYEMVQLLKDDISEAIILKIIKNVEILYTYNGTRFDLPFIKSRLGIDLTNYCSHIDLMYECWRRRLYGGLKRVEKQLEIKRKLAGIDGRMAVKLWYDYEHYGNQQALVALLEYNKEDVLNLRLVREKLGV
ncbi:MAG: ribonuclease H-like domain-containing protein [Candidatus Desantisbacteria bacterium]